MKKIIIALTVIALGAIGAYGQNKSTLLQRINEIKSQTDLYFWDQYTCPDADTAKVNATRRLLLDVNSNRAENDQLSVEEIMPHASFINIDRGNLKQFFVYIKKTEAMALTNRVAPPTDNGITMVSPRPVVPKTFVPDAFVQRLMETKQFMDVYKLLKWMQSQGQVLQFGKLRDVEDYSSLDLILFDNQSQEIVTILSSVTPSGYRINQVTGAEDALENYPAKMTAVIWYIKK